MSESSTKKFRVLSIDGGGIRGLIPARVLADLEQEIQRESPGAKLYEYFDLVCGTSTGAILAVAIALGVPAVDLVAFYHAHAKAIFPKWYLKVLPRKSRALFTSIYSNKDLRQLLAKTYASANNGVIPLISDCKTKICIPTFNGNDGKINVLKTKHCSEYSRDYKIPAHEAVLSSASAPIYLPPHSFTFSNEYGSGANVNMIDGGIFANNPTLIGLLEASDKLNQNIEDISILSIGTGQGRHIVKKRWRPKDLFYWLLPKPRLLDMILDSQAQITEQYIAFIRRVFGTSGKEFGYLRVQHDMGGDIIDLNASSKRDLARLEAIGGELSKNNLQKILQFINK
jgi:patatin-like phospholipase/acyl hydrolase